MTRFQRPTPENKLKSENINTCLNPNWIIPAIDSSSSSPALILICSSVRWNLSLSSASCACSMSCWSSLCICSSLRRRNSSFSSLMRSLSSCSKQQRNQLLALPLHLFLEQAQQLIRLLAMLAAQLQQTTVLSMFICSSLRRRKTVAPLAPQCTQCSLPRSICGPYPVCVGSRRLWCILYSKHDVYYRSVLT